MGCREYISPRNPAAKSAVKICPSGGWTTARCVANYDGFFTAMSRDLLLHFHPHSALSIGNLRLVTRVMIVPDSNLRSQPLLHVSSIRFLPKQNIGTLFIDRVEVTAPLRKASYHDVNYLATKYRMKLTCAESPLRRCANFTSACQPLLSTLSLMAAQLINPDWVMLCILNRIARGVVPPCSLTCPPPNSSES